MGGRGGSKGGGGGGPLTGADLQQNQITGLNARDLKTAWKHTFGQELTSAQQVYDLLGVSKSMLGARGEILVSGGRHGSALRIYAGGPEFNMTRTFHDGAVSHDTFFLSKNAQGNGIGTKVLTQATKSYAQLGVKKISLEAAMAGRYVWPKMGFRASASDMQQYREGFTKFLRAQGVEPPKRIYSLNQIARTELNGRKLGKEYLLSRDAPNLTHMTIRTARLAKYLSGR